MAKQTSLRKRMLVIVIGTSAGGLSALSTLLEALPASYPFPILVVQHRGKEPRELLEQVLQEKCLLWIKQADEKEEILAPAVYIAPPDYHLLVELDGSLSLSSEKHVNYSRPSIDVLFETAAAAYGENLSGILLTGSNADGARGLESIRKKGGFTIAQDPKEAQYPVMPEAAIALGAAQQIWTLAEIKTYLTETLLNELHEEK